MADTEKVIIQLVLEKKDFNKSLQSLSVDAEKAGAKTGKEFGRGFASSIKAGQSFRNVFNDITKSIFNVRNALALTFTGGFFLQKAVKSASQFESQLTGLTSVANRFGISTERIKDVTLSLVNDGLVPLDNITGALKNSIVSTKGDLDLAVKSFKSFRDSASFNRQGQLGLGEAIERTTQGIRNQISATSDSAGVGENLSQVNAKYAKSIGKTVGQLTEQEKKLGSTIELTKLASFFTGDFEKLQNTFSGATSRLNTVFSTFLIRIGEFITKSPLAIRLLGDVSKFIGKLSDDLTKVDRVDFLKNLIVNAIDFGIKIKKFVIDPLVLFARTIDVAFNSVVAGFDVILAGAARFGAAVAKFLPEDNPLRKFAEDFKASTDAVATDQLDILNEKLDNLFSDEKGEKAVLFLQKIKAAVLETATAVQNVTVPVEGSTVKVEESFIRILKTAKGSSKAIGNAVKQGIGQTATAGIQALTKSLILGEKGFDNFGKKVAGILGDLATQLGQTLLLTGIGMKGLTDLSGTKAIVAGAGLIALGTILKSFSGGAGGASDVGGGAVGAGVQETITPDEPAEREGPNTEVVVNVQGDVLDADETGLRIVNILNEAYDKQGVVINRGILA